MAGVSACSVIGQVATLWSCTRRESTTTSEFCGALAYLLPVQPGQAACYQRKISGENRRGGDV